MNNSYIIELMRKSTIRRLQALLSLLSLVSLYVLAPVSAMAQDAGDILQQTRQAFGVQSLKIAGTVRHQKVTQPFALEHHDGKLILKTGDTSTSFRGPSSNVSHYSHQAIAPGIPLSHSDLIWSWLWSREPYLLGPAQLRTRKTWQINVPDAANARAHTKVWIDQENYAPLKTEYYDKNQLSRRTELVSGQKINGVWLPREIRIEKFVPPGSRRPSRSYVEISEYRGPTQ